jgi:hypothetical protein
MPVPVTSPSTPEMLEVSVEMLVVRFRTRTDTVFLAQLLAAL